MVFALLCTYSENPFSGCLPIQSRLSETIIAMSERTDSDREDDDPSSGTMSQSQQNANPPEQDSYLGNNASSALNQALLFHQAQQQQQQQQQQHQHQQSRQIPSNNGASGHHANPLDNLAHISTAASSAIAAQQQAQLKHFLGQAGAQQQRQQPFPFLQPGSYGGPSLPNLSSQLPGLTNQPQAQVNPMQHLQALISLSQQGNIPQGSLWNSQQHINSLLAAAASSTVTPTSGGGMGNGNSQQNQANSLLYNSYPPASGGAQQYQVPVIPSSTAALPSNRPSIHIYMDRDEENLTEYQCLLRKQIELFEAGSDDIRSNAQGRNTPILLGQVGLRCRYCAPLPRAARTKGAVYYSQTIDGIYQVAQNMSKVHLCERCHRIPREVQDKLKALRGDNQRAVGGKHYWADGVRALGVYEDGRVLRLNPDPGDAPAS
jgi:hypothetical protein